MTTSK